ncbi:MAG TPA: hypothetical protein VFZ96_04750 [Actinomycetota bacterium]|nr:hypothetical protein [Actinomycetota bacterium]
MRLAGLDGLSAIGHRPGAPALALAAGGTLGLSEVQVVAALEGALGVATGLAGAALVRAGGGRRAAWLLAGVLSGTFAVHLAAGYLANLAFAAAFLTAAAMLASGTIAGAVGAAGVLGAGGLAHPLFFLVGGGVLLLSAALAWRADRAEALRVGGAALGAGAVVGAGLLALLIGPDPLEVDTSKDAFLRRAGLAGELRSAYLDRFVHRWARYVQWASVPLAIAGLRPAVGFLGRFLRAWGLVTIVGVAVSVATGLAPADRFVTFGFVVPVLAALGVVRLWDALAARRALAAAAAGALTIAMLAGAWIAWDRQEPFLRELEVRRVTDAGPWLGTAGEGSALVFPVNDDDPAVTFLATRAGNVIRAAVPPERIRDVVVVVPAPQDDADAVRGTLTRVTLEDAARASAERGGRRLDVLLAPFDRVDAAGASASGSPWLRVSTGVFLSAAEGVRGDVPSSPLEPSSPAGIGGATLAAIVLLGVVGFGWARAAGSDRIAAIALAPAVGTAAVTIAAIALERLGLPLDGSGPAGAFVSALAGVGGYGSWLVLERRARARPTP